MNNTKDKVNYYNENKNFKNISSRMSNKSKVSGGGSAKGTTDKG
jgi:hypothetical protein